MTGVSNNRSESRRLPISRNLRQAGATFHSRTQQEFPPSGPSPSHLVVENNIEK